MCGFRSTGAPRRSRSAGNGHHPSAVWGHAQCELPGTSAEVDHGGVLRKAEPPQESHLLDGTSVLLGVIAPDVIRVEVLPTALATSSSIQPGSRGWWLVAVMKPSCQWYSPLRGQAPSQGDRLTKLLVAVPPG